MASAVDRTRRTLFFPAFYLLSGGLGFLLTPDLALRLMFSNGDYGEPMVRFVGTLTMGLGAIVVQIIRHRIVALYTTVIWVRVFFCSCYFVLWTTSRDPLFLVLLGMVGLGMTATAVSWLKER